MFLASDQLRTVQNVQTARVEAMGHCLGEINNLLLQRELRMETQIFTLSSQSITVLNAMDVLRRSKVEQSHVPVGRAKTAHESSAKLSTPKLHVEETKINNPVLAASDA